MIARVLVPLDGLAEHDAAIPVALRLAARLGAGTELVSVVDPGLVDAGLGREQPGHEHDVVDRPGGHLAIGLPVPAGVEGEGRPPARCGEPGEVGVVLLLGAGAVQDHDPRPRRGRHPAAAGLGLWRLGEAPLRQPQRVGEAGLRPLAVGPSRRRQLHCG